MVALAYATIVYVKVFVFKFLKQASLFLSDAIYVKKVECTMKLNFLIATNNAEKI